MNERLRQEYLDALDIIQFVPRRILAGAKASEPAFFPELAADDLPPVHEDVTSTAPPRQAAALESSAPKAVVSDLVQSIIRDAGPANNLPGSPAPTNPPPDNGKAVELEILESEIPARFALSVWRPSASLMIVDSRHLGDALPTRTLLQNILRAKSVEASGAAPDILSWPPPGLTQILGWSAAQDMVSAFLQARLDLQPAQYIWLMGESAYRAVLSPTGSYTDDLGKAMNVDQLGVLAVVLPSLAEMLQYPELKARTWAAIRSLHIR